MISRETARKTDEFDARLRRALRGRPEPIPTFDLAQQAMRRAAASDRTARALTRLGRQRRWMRAVNIGAMLLVAAILIHDGRRVVQFAPSFISATDSPETASTPLLGACACCGSILILAVRRAFEPHSNLLQDAR